MIIEPEPKFEKIIKKGRKSSNKNLKIEPNFDQIEKYKEDKIKEFKKLPSIKKKKSKVIEDENSQDVINKKDEINKEEDYKYINDKKKKDEELDKTSNKLFNEYILN
jgi:hypothetical protein